MKEENLALAVLLAKKTGLHGKASTSTSALASETGYSQQSISRKLRELEADGALSRSVSPLGISVSFTEKGKKELESLYLELKEIFSAKKKAVLKGKVVDGLGEGTYYTSLPEYKKQFKEAFGLDLFPGTLNLEVNPDERNVFTAVLPVRLQGFSTNERTFGGIDCWPCRVNAKADAIAILPHRTNHPANIIELVASYSIRKKLGLKNGSVVELVRS